MYCMWIYIYMHIYTYKHIYSIDLESRQNYIHIYIIWKCFCKTHLQTPSSVYFMKLVASFFLHYLLREC